MSASANATASTTMVNVTAIPTEAAEPPPAAPRPQRGQALLPLALSACLLVLGLPRLVSALTMLPTEPVLNALHADRPVSDAELDRLERRLSIARQFSSSGRIAIDLAAAKLAAVDRLPNRAQSARRELIDDAVALLEDGLAETPANSFAWARLAYARSLKNGLGPAAADGWRMSVLTAPADRRLALWRTRLGIALVSSFIEGDRALLDGQIDLAWRSNHEELARYAKAAGPEVTQIVRAALVNQPEELERFDGLTR